MTDNERMISEIWNDRLVNLDETWEVENETNQD